MTVRGRPALFMMMPRLLHRRTLTPLALGLLLLTSLLPLAVSTWVTRLPLDLVETALKPLRTPLHRFATSLRGPRPHDTTAPDGELAAEYETLRRLYEEEVLKLEQARQMIADLRGYHQRAVLTGKTLRTAAVIGAGRDAEHPTLVLDVGGADGVSEGQVVVAGEDLAGRVSRVQIGTAEARLITGRHQVLQVRLVAPVAGQAPPSPPLRMRYDPQAQAFTAVVSIIEETRPRVGDLAILDDPDWPTARAMVVGRVAALEPLPQDPQRRATLFVRPRRNLAYLGSAIVIVPEAP